MGISGALNNAVSGLTANARMAETVSSNLANALTDGYGRRSVDLSSAMVGGQGAGVRVDGITRYVNTTALSDRRLADADLNARQRTADAFARLDSIFGQADDPSSLSGRIAALEQALVSAGADPASDQRLSVVQTRLANLARTLNTTADEMQRMRQDADQAIASDIDTLNFSLKRVETLNADIARTINTGGDPSALQDSRQLAIDKIASIVPIRQLDRESGKIALMTTTGEVMIDGPAAQYAFTRTPTIIADMTLVSGALSGVTRNGVPLSVTNGFGKLSGGSLQAAFDLRDRTLPEAQTGLDVIARDLIDRFADTATDPTHTLGSAGLLTDGGAAFDPLDLDGLSARISLNAAVDPAQGGLLSRLRDGVEATIAGPVGSSAQIDRWRSALTEPRSALPGGLSLSAAGHIASAGSQIGVQRVRADEELSFAASRRDTLHAVELAGGVDSDFELQMLMRIEQAYAANARVIQTVGAMIQRLMEI